MPMILESILPILLLTILGWWLKHAAIIAPEQWNGFEKVTYLVCFPALIVHALAKADLKSVPAGGTAISMLVAVGSVGLLLLALRPLLQSRFGISGPTFTSVFQGSTRWNTFMALGLAGSLYGERGLTLVAVAVAVIPPLLNVVSVMLLHHFAGSKGSIEWSGILKNPFVWSSFLGLMLNFLGLPIPAPIMVAVDYLGRASLGAALLLVGSGLMLSDLSRPTLPVMLASGLKLVILPLIAITTARAFGIAGDDLGTIIICAAVPTAGAAYILSRQMGGDHRSMAAIITVETMASAITLPVMLLLLG